MRIRISQFLVGVGVVGAIFFCSCSSSNDVQKKGQNQPGAAQYEKVYSESPAAWYEAAGGVARISSDGRWALYPSYMRGTRLINLETGREDPGRFAVDMDRVARAAFYMGNQLARFGQKGGQQGWFVPGPDGPQLTSVPTDANPQWSPDGSEVAYYLRRQPEKGLFVGNAERQKPYPIDGEVTGFVWSPDGGLVYALAWHDDGSSSLVRIDPKAGRVETLAGNLDARSRLNPLGASADGKHLYIALASSTSPVAEARHQPDADRDLDIYELELVTGARRVMVQEPGDDFSPCMAGGFLYWTHNDIHDSVVVLPLSGGPARVVVDEGTLPCWSSDGKQIAVTYSGWRLADSGLNLDAGIVNVDAEARRVSQMKPIISGYHEDFTPAWSPDGQWLAFHSHRSRTPVPSYSAEGSTDDLYLRRASGGPDEEIRLTDFGWEVGPADWSPDGHSLVFSSWERGGRQGVSKPWIVTIDPSNGKPVRVERLPLPDPIKSADDVSWSPKGDEIVFDERTGGNGRILWVISTDGKRAEKIVEYTASTYGGLDWTPDGKTIVFGALAGERMQIFAVPRSGGSPRQLTDDPANLMHPQVSPDGRWIACTRMLQSKEIRRLKL
jgi:Tol biopolymer transport system component